MLYPSQALTKNFKFFTGGHWLSLTRHTRPFCLHVERVSPGCAEHGQGVQGLVEIHAAGDMRAVTAAAKSRPARGHRFFGIFRFPGHNYP